MLQIFNSLSRSKEPFKPLNEGKVGIYVCGMTVYDYCHIGHARVLVVFDIVTRFLRANGYDVNYVRNITDVDDKIIKRANEAGIAIDELTKQFIDAMHEDAAALHILPPTSEPRATEYIKQMIALIETLVEKDMAYVAENGDVCYAVAKFDNYGALAHKDIEGLRAGERVQIQQDKRDPLDFVLWKSVKPDEPSWPSPWGAGRPGWHIECSAMSLDCLGEEFDLHGGGFDLQFPHHENEIAQSCAATGKKFAKGWMHVGFVNVDNEKMSKSLNNFFTIREVLKKYEPEVIRYFMIASHYRSQVNYSEDTLKNARGALERMYLALRDVEVRDAPSEHPLRARFLSAMNDDFNTPEALAAMFDCARELNTVKMDGSSKAGELAGLLLEMAGILGILQDSPENFLRGAVSDSDVVQIESLIKERDQARADKNWARADELRDQLSAMGVTIEDASGKTSWRRE